MGEGKTEWEDILISKGIIDAPEKVATADDLHLENLDLIDELKQERMDLKSLEQLSEEEDELDEDVLEHYKKKKLIALKKKKALNVYGEMKRIVEADFVKEVTEASNHTFVICHLYVHGKLECKIMDRALAQLADKFKMVKFIRIKAFECIRNYPDKNCPTVLIYHKTKIHKSFVGLAEFNGLDTKADNVEWELFKIGCIQSDMEHNPRRKAKSVMDDYIGKGTNNNHKEDKGNTFITDEELFDF